VEEKMKLSLTLTENDNEITVKILTELKKQLDKRFNKAIPKIKTSVQSLVKEALINEPEYISLKTGTLRAEFGIEFPENVDRVIDALVNTIDVTINPIQTNKNRLTGGFFLTMIKKDDMSGVIYTDIASVIDKKGYILPWLEWLLLKNNKILVNEYSVEYNTNVRSRSGMAIMVESKNNWRVPPEFAGSINNNWITRSLEKIDSQIIDIIKQNIEN
jgi:hypothetical protein